MPTIREAVDALEERLFVGRTRDLDAFGEFLERPAGPEPQLLNVHGPGGVGKSALLAAYRRIAERAGRPVVLVDGRSVPAEPAACVGPAPAPPAPPASTAKAPTLAPAVAGLNERKPLLLVDAFEEL